jgi:hypothetical protein
LIQSNDRPMAPTKGPFYCHELRPARRTRNKLRVRGELPSGGLHAPLWSPLSRTPDPGPAYTLSVWRR